MKLYYAPGACSLSPHISLREAGVEFEIVKVDTATHLTESGADFKAVNPKGYVPALVLETGDVVTEGAAVVQYIADRFPKAGLAPANGTLERTRLQVIHHARGRARFGAGDTGRPPRDRRRRSAGCVEGQIALLPLPVHRERGWGEGAFACGNRPICNHPNEPSRPPLSLSTGRGRQRLNPRSRALRCDRRRPCAGPCR